MLTIPPVNNEYLLSWNGLFPHLRELKEFFMYGF